MAIKANIVIEQGTDFSKTFDALDSDGNLIDLTNYTAASQMRKNYATNTATTFTCTTDGANGHVTIELTNAETEVLEPGRYLYDVEVTSSANTVSRIVEGTVVLSTQN